MKRKRKKHTPAFKAKVALAAVREQEPVTEIARRFKVHVTMVHRWKKQLLDNLTTAFETPGGDGSDAQEREAELLRKIGELTMERDFLSDGLDRLR